MSAAFAAAVTLAVCAEPWRDDLRLVAADAFDDAGEGARAEFIRAQVRLARLEVAAPSSYRNTDEAHALRRRERALWVEYGRRLVDLPPCADEWLVRLAGTRELPPSGTGLALVSRGFVGAVTLDAAAFLRHARELFAAAPVERVTLRDREPVGWKAAGDGEERWTWGTDASTVWVCPSILPAALFGLLRGYRRDLRGYRRDSLDDTRRYNSEAAALDALAAACRLHARTLNGFPDWPAAPK
jgi:uncharacterized protein (TIGR02996 family)